MRHAGAFAVVAVEAGDPVGVLFRGVLVNQAPLAVAIDFDVGQGFVTILVTIGPRK